MDLPSAWCARPRPAPNARPARRPWASTAVAPPSGSPHPWGGSSNGSGACAASSPWLPQSSPGQKAAPASGASPLYGTLSERRRRVRRREPERGREVHVRAFLHVVPGDQRHLGPGRERPRGALVRVVVGGDDHAAADVRDPRRTCGSGRAPGRTHPARTRRSPRRARASGSRGRSAAACCRRRPRTGSRCAVPTPGAPRRTSKAAPMPRRGHDPGSSAGTSRRLPRDRSRRSPGPGPRRRGGPPAWPGPPAAW